MGRKLTPQEEAAWDRAWNSGRSQRHVRSSAASLWRAHVPQLAHAIKRLWDSELCFLVSVVILVAVVIAVGIGIIDHIHRVDSVFGQVVPFRS